MLLHSSFSGNNHAKLEFDLIEALVTVIAILIVSKYRRQGQGGGFLYGSQFNIG